MHRGWRTHHEHRRQSLSSSVWVRAPAFVWRLKKINYLFNPYRYVLRNAWGHKKGSLQICTVRLWCGYRERKCGRSWFREKIRNTSQLNLHGMINLFEICHSQSATSLKNLIGHTKIEVLVGALLGFFVSLAVYTIMWYPILYPKSNNYYQRQAVTKRISPCNKQMEPRQWNKEPLASKHSEGSFYNILHSNQHFIIGIAINGKGYITYD